MSLVEEDIQEQRLESGPIKKKLNKERTKLLVTFGLLNTIIKKFCTLKGQIFWIFPSKIQMELLFNFLIIKINP
jgi:hypothetical protein